jgi:hypothetical protein
MHRFALKATMASIVALTAILIGPIVASIAQARALPRKLTARISVPAAILSSPLRRCREYR